MFFRVVCHFSPFLLSTGRQIDTGRKTSTAAGRQAGRGRLMWQEGRLQYVGDCASILTRARKSSLPSGAYLPFSDLQNSLFSSLWREGLLSQRQSIVWDEFVGPGISPIWAWSVKCPVLSLCLSEGYMFCRVPSHHLLLSAVSHRVRPK